MIDFKSQKQISLAVKVCTIILLLAIMPIPPFIIKANNIILSSEALKVMIKETEASKQKAIRMTEEIKLFDQKLSAYMAVGQERDILWPQVLRLIGNVCPKDVRTTNISTIKPMSYKIVGEALSESNIYRFAKGLQKTTLIESAEVEEIEYVSKDSYYIVNYRIICIINRIRVINRWSRYQ